MSNYEYVDDSYALDGYIWTSRQIIFTYGANRLELSGPAARSGWVKLLQPEEFSAGWEHYGYTPVVALHSLSLDYKRLRPDEATGLVAFRAAVDDITQQINYIDGATGATIPCWLDEMQQEIDQAGYNQYQGKVALIATTPFIPFPGSPPANLDTILATAQYPYKQTIQRKQPRIWMSDGTPHIYNTSSVKRTLHGMALVRKNAADLGALLSYFVNTAVGIKNKWTWTDGGVSHQVRFAESEIQWRQSPVNTALYDMDLTLEEDA